MTRALAAVAALTALALTGCESAKDSRRNTVNSYIASVNGIQQETVQPWAHAQNAYNELSAGLAVGEPQLRTLAAVPGTIRSLRQRIAVLDPPEDAKRLHASLLRLLDLDAKFAEEVTSFARYTRGVSPLQKRVAAETTRLRRELQRSRTSGPERQALARYATELDVLLERVRRLTPPPALAPWHAQQVTRVARLRRGARDLADGLARRDRALTQRGLTTFTAAATASPVTVADRAAILAYNRRLSRIRAVAAAVAQEQSRLSQALT